jgi:hypothetical protein
MQFVINARDDDPAKRQDLYSSKELYERLRTLGTLQDGDLSPLEILLRCSDLHWLKCMGFSDHVIRDYFHDDSKITMDRLRQLIYRGMTPEEINEWHR